MPRHTFACMSDVDYITQEARLALNDLIFYSTLGLIFCHDRVLTNLYTTYYLQLCHYKYLGNVVCWTTERKLQN